MNAQLPGRGRGGGALRLRWLALGLALWAGVALAESASESTALHTDDLFDISLEDLLNVEIVSASRRETARDRLSVPVSVLTAEEIHLSGATNIPEALQLVPGVDVRRLDRSRYIVGVRGLLSQYSDRTLVLINGRDTLNPAQGAPDWLSLPVLMEDIDRIEVVRGPGGAVWGANAFTGVINIITKEPADARPLVSGALSDFGDVFSHVRAAERGRRVDWRVSVGYDDARSSQDAGAGTMHSSLPALNGLMGFSHMSARDDVSALRLDSAATWHLGPQSDLRLGVAHADTTGGTREFVGRDPEADVRQQRTRMFARWQRRDADDAQSHVQLYANHGVSHMPQMVARFAYWVQDLEVGRTVHLGERHELTVGGNLRWLDSHSQNQVLPGEVVYPAHQDESWTGAFVVDRMVLSPAWSLEGQVRGDYYSVTGWDWAGRLAALYALGPDDRHHLRVAVARAFRTPGIALRQTTLTGVGGLFNIVPNRSVLHNESTTSWEFGYTGQWGAHLQVQADLYYQRMEDLIGNVDETAGPVHNNYFANVGGADTYGAETEWLVHHRAGRLSLWYTFNGYDLDQTQNNVRAFMPTVHRAGVRSLWNLPGAWTGAVNYVYLDQLAQPPAGATSYVIKPLHRLDLTLSHRWPAHHAELLVGVLDVINQTRGPLYDMAEFTGTETPGRTFILRGQWGF